MIKQKVINMKQRLSIKEIDQMLFADKSYCNELKEIGMINHDK